MSVHRMLKVVQQWIRPGQTRPTPDAPDLDVVIPDGMRPRDWSGRLDRAQEPDTDVGT